MSGSPSPDDLAQWSLHCFCLGARTPPQALVRQPPMGRLLHALADWCEIGDLQARGLRFSADDIERLRDFRLIERQGTRLRATFPRLGPERLLPLRRQIGDEAATLLRQIDGALHDLSRRLERLNLPASRHAVVIGHVLDGLLWLRLRDALDLPDTAPNAEYPHWRGVFWALYPGIPTAAGTNEVAVDDARLTLVWTPQNAAVLNAIRRQDWPRDLLRFLRGDAIRPPEAAIATGLLDAEGRPRIPVFGSDRHAALAGQAERLAGVCAAWVLEWLGRNASLPELPAPQRSVILLHELIWAVDENLARRGPDWRPAAPQDARAAIFAKLSRPAPQADDPH